jgi:hypothetical protein
MPAKSSSRASFLVFAIISAVVVTSILYARSAVAENVAVGAKVEGSSSYSEETRPANAVDGKYATRWLNRADDQQPSIVIDFGRPRTIKAVGIVLDPNAPTEYLRCSWDVQNLADGAKQDKLATVTDNAKVRSLATFAPVTTNRIQIQFTKNSPWGNINRIFEIEVWSDHQDMTALPEVGESFPGPLYPENNNWRQPATYSGPGQPSKTVIAVDLRPQLFVDNYLIAESSNIARELNKPKKHDGPILVGDKPWENNDILHPCVVKVNGKFKMWYLTLGHIYPSRSTGDPPVTDSNFLCYATSDDGINWTKPSLGTIDYKGSKDNNIFIRHQGSHFDSPSVFYRPGQEYSYKALFYQGTWPYEKELIEAKGYKFAITKSGHYPFHSKDGIHWEYMEAKPKPVWASDRSNASYDSERNLYIGDWKNPYKGTRSRMYAESKDLVNWSAPRWLLIPQWLSDPASKVDPKGTNFYGHIIFNYGALYMGVLEILNETDHRMHLQLMSSRDLVNWNRMSAPEAFIDHGEGEEWDRGRLQMGNTEPVRHNDELLFYFSGTRMDHSPRSARSGQPRGIGMARMPVDRFAAVYPSDFSTDAVLTTVPLKLSGKALHVNAEAAQGMVKLELLDVNGNVIPGFGREDCAGIVLKDSVDNEIIWKSGKALPSTDVKIRFILNSAKLYAFSCR